MRSKLISTYEFDEIVVSNGDESFQYRLEVFQREQSGLYWGRLLRLEHYRLNSSFATRAEVGWDKELMVLDEQITLPSIDLPSEKDLLDSIEASINEVFFKRV